MTKSPPSSWLSVGLLLLALCGNLPAFCKAQEQLEPPPLGLATCTAQLLQADRTDQGVVDSVEFVNFMTRASPYRDTNCPDLRSLGDFLPGGRFYAVLSEVSCYCLDYDTEDDRCCSEPIIRTDNRYGTEYTQRVCQRIAEALTKACGPSVAPTASPAPSAAIQERPPSLDEAVPTSAPTAASTTTATTKTDTDVTTNDSADTDGGSILDIPRYQAPTGYKSLPRWLRIAAPFFAVALFACLVVCVDCTRHRKSKAVTKNMISVGEGQSVNHDSLTGAPEDLTEWEGTQGSLEEGRLVVNESASSKDKDKNKKKGPVALPPPTSPQRMSAFLDSLDLEKVAAPKAKSTKKKVPQQNAKAASTQVKKAAAGSATPTPSTPKKKVRVPPQKPKVKSTTGATPLPQKTDDSAPLTPGKKKSPKKKSKSSPKKKTKTKDGAATAAISTMPVAALLHRTYSGNSTSSAEVFVGPDDDASASSGSASGRIKWRLVHPSTLVSSGAVEVFPLPPVVASYVTSGSLPPPSPEDGESKEEDKGPYGYDDDDSDSDVYLSQDESQDSHYVTKEVTSSQPDPDGVRLEDGHQYRELWLEANRVGGHFDV